MLDVLRVPVLNLEDIKLRLRLSEISNYQNSKFLQIPLRFPSSYDTYLCVRQTGRITRKHMAFRPIDRSRKRS